MTDLRRLPVISPTGKRLILVVNGSFFTGMEGGEFLREDIPVEAIIAVEECPDDIQPTITMGWNPNSP